MISTKTNYQALLKTAKPDDNYKSQILPQPVGSFPYRLRLAHSDVPCGKEKLVFHMVGDTGGKKSSDPQQRIAAQMTKQYRETPATERPAFLYHLGDIVYHFGEAEHYESQFLKPFEHYPPPVYAIAGNHDADVNPESECPYGSLDAFYTAFCNTSPKSIYFAPETSRKSQVQPHVYWTMISDLAIIIGLHTNVPKYGHIDREQRSWFVNELRHAATCHSEKALLVCLHHAPYSGDMNHGSSEVMIQLLESAFTETGVKPDAVFSGHVHNYQRFNKHYEDGKTVPYIVAGAGGFDELHALADPFDPAFDAENELFEQVRLENYCDNRHGFLKISVEKSPLGLTLEGSYYTINSQYDQEEASLFDQFSLDLPKP